VAAIFDSLEDKQLVKLLKDGAVGVLPTDTIYGLVCIAAKQESVKSCTPLKKEKTNRVH